MEVEMSEEVKQVYIETAKVLKGSERRFSRLPHLGERFVRIAPRSLLRIGFFPK